jgi:hypothetical protein
MAIDLSNLGDDGAMFRGGAEDCGCSGDLAGWSVALAGDVNGDGFDDIIIGAPGTYSASYEGYTGAAYVVFGHANGFTIPIELRDLSTSEGFVIYGAYGGDALGSAVSAAGDINGDGFFDIVVGAPFAYGAGDTYLGGKSYVIFGKGPLGDTDPPPTGADFGVNGVIDLTLGLAPGDGFTISGGAEYDYSGNALSQAGDFNGDGIADLVVAAPGYDFYRGAFYVVFGDNSTPAGPGDIDLSTLSGSGRGIVIFGEFSGDQAVPTPASTCVSAGDINGDGLGDIIVGAPYAYSASVGAPTGAVWVVFGRAGTSDIDLADFQSGVDGFKISGDEPLDLTGFSVSGAGDVNGDGFDDVIVGVPGCTVSYVVFGGATPVDIDLSDPGALDGSNGFAILAGPDDFGLGLAVSGAGDFNRDGFDDVVISAIEVPDGIGGSGSEEATLAQAEPAAGNVYVIFGSNAGFPAAIDLVDVANGIGGFVVHGEDENDLAGWSLSDAGDFNQDGFDDLLIGAPFAESADLEEGAGRAYLIFGAPTPLSVDLDLATPGVNFASSYTENSTAAAIGGAVDIAYSLVGTLAAATVTITDFVAGDELGIGDPAGPPPEEQASINAATGPISGTNITANYNGAGILTLTGNDTVENYEAALARVQFSSTSSNPTSGGTNPTRTLDISITDGTSNSNTAVATIALTEASNHPGPDFNGDNRSDIFWRHDGGSTTLWMIDNGQVVDAIDFGVIDSSWHALGRGDFNGDHTNDVLWRNDSGFTCIWQMQNGQVQGGIELGVIGASWDVEPIGDFNGDGNSDIFWRNDDGTATMWMMDGGQVGSAVQLGPIGSAWRVETVGDFDADGRSDILWRQDNGLASIWLMDGGTIKAGFDLGIIGQIWETARSGDFDGDAKDDILWRQNDDRTCIWKMNGGTVESGQDLGVLNPGFEISDVGDYTGDALADILWRGPAGQTELWEMDGPTQVNTSDLGTVGPSWHVVDDHMTI